MTDLQTRLAVLIVIVCTCIGCAFGPSLLLFSYNPGGLVVYLFGAWQGFLAGAAIACVYRGLHYVFTGR